MPPTRGISCLSLVLYGIRIGGFHVGRGPCYLSYLTQQSLLVINNSTELSPTCLQRVICTYKWDSRYPLLHWMKSQNSIISRGQICSQGIDRTNWHLWPTKLPVFLLNFWPELSCHQITQSDRANTKLPTWIKMVPSHPVTTKHTWLSSGWQRRDKDQTTKFRRISNKICEILWLNLNNMIAKSS